MGHTWRGHPIVLDRKGFWRYEDTGKKVSENPYRACGFCRLLNTPEGHDGCLGTLPNVMNACCGHGEEAAAYVQFPADRISGKEALEWIRQNATPSKHFGGPPATRVTVETVERFACVARATPEKP